ncbi:glycosyl transferase [Weissella viridescens]|uniref:Glycosyl transferase n=1 Tax=Weissella viridescens TaxID=1629 RepID=A0A3P2RDF3_WEIVI|nr:YfhO family protein [Weissella viridescens]RRG17796.1 glycosyl transferase [Weissella viridescens]
MINRKNWWKSNLPVYLIMFLIVVGIILLPYWLTNTSLIWQADGLSQHLPALIHWQKDLHHLLATGNWPSQWNFKIGLGADYYQTFAYYTLGDVFSYGAAFISSKHIVSYYSIMIIVRLFCAGLAFLVAVRHFTKYWQPVANTIATLVYLFTGYLALSMFSHPYFINPLIIFPLLIVAIDNLINRDNPKWFPAVFMIAWALWNNYYFAFMMAIGATIFFVLNISLTHAWRNWKMWVRTISSSLVGFLLPMLIFLPSLMGTLSSARSQYRFANGLSIYPLNYYLALPGNLINNAETPNFWLTGGFSVIGIIAILFVWRRFRTYPLLGWVFVIAGIFLLFPAGAAIMNGGSSPSNRWIFMLGLPLGLSVVYLLNHLPELQKRDFYWMTGIGAIIFMSILFSNNFDLHANFANTLFIGMLTIFCLYWSISHKIGLYALLGVVALNAIVIMQQNHTTDLNPEKGTLLSNSNVQKLIDQQSNYFDENIDNTLAKDRGEKTSPVPSTLYRSYIETQLGTDAEIDPAPSTNLALNSPAHNAESYWSYQSGAVNQLMKQLELPRSNNNDITSNLDRRNILANVFGIKYWYANRRSDAPASYHKLTPPITINRQNVTQSDLVYPLAYLPKYVVSEKTFAKADATNREAYLADGVVTNAAPETTSKHQLERNVTSASIRSNLQANYQKKVHFSYTPNRESDEHGIYLKPDATLSNTELHLEISNLHFKPANFNERAQFATNSYRDGQQERSYNPRNPLDYRTNDQAFNWNWRRKHLNSIGKNVSGYTFTTSYAGNDQTFIQTGKKNLSFYNPRQNITLNLGPATDVKDTTYLPLQFSQPGHYTFDVKIKAVPTGRLFKKAAQHAQKHAVPLNIQNDKISGAVTSAKPQILTTSIPYSKGWQSVNNQLIKVNEGFLGIKLHSGQNNLRLTYQTPGLKLGKLLSLLGIALLIILSLWYLIRKKAISHAD